MKISKINKDRYGYAFIAPYFICFAIFGAFAMIYTIYLSFTDFGGIGDINFIGFKNYAAILKDKFFLKSIANTFILWIISVIPQMICAVVLAVILVQSKLKGKGFFRAVFYLPNLVTMSSVAVLFRFIMDWKSGALNQILISIGIIQEPINWFSKELATQATVGFINWWMWFGYSMIIFMAGIQAISNDVIEAATVDGANGRQMLTKITLPLIKPTIIYSIITSMIGGMTLFDIPFVLTNGDGAPSGSILTMVMYLYNTAFRNYRYGYAATIGVCLFILLGIMVFISYRVMNKKNAYE